MKYKIGKKGFTLVELLAVIVILAILMVAAGTAVMSTMNNAKVNTFKNEALTAINMAEKMYTEISMNADDSATYLRNDSTSQYKGMCVTLQGLVNNGYLEKDLHDGAIYGTVLVEVPFDGGQTKYSIWMSDGTYGIQGYEKNKISKLKFNSANNNLITLDYLTPGTGIVTKLDGIKILNHSTHYRYTALPLKIRENTPVTETKFVYEHDTRVGTRIYKFKSIGGENGGTGATYNDIFCINKKIK